MQSKKCLKEHKNRFSKKKTYNRIEQAHYIDGGGFQFWGFCKILLYMQHREGDRLNLYRGKLIIRVAHTMDRIIINYIIITGKFYKSDNVIRGG